METDLFANCDWVIHGQDGRQHASGDFLCTYYVCESMEITILTAHNPIGERDLVNGTLLGQFSPFVFFPVRWLY